MKVLIMDDDDIFCRFIQKTLSHLGYEVEIAYDGVKAIELYKTAKKYGHPFDIVIMDLTIPEGMDGKETIRRLLEFDPDAKAIVSSGYSNDPVMSHYREYGFKGVVAKPYIIEDLCKTIADALK